MTYRPLWMRGRPLHDLKVCDMANPCIIVSLMWFDMELHNKTNNYVIYKRVT